MDLATLAKLAGVHLPDPAAMEKTARTILAEEINQALNSFRHQLREDMRAILAEPTKTMAQRGKKP